MKINSVLVVCVGNICRSPVGAALLARSCPDLRVESAGIGALEGHGADKTSAEIAAEAGLNLDSHIARQFTAEIASEFDLILGLEKGHLRVINSKAPASSGKTLLFGQWLNQSDIADPYRKSREFHALVFDEISKAAESWAKKLGCI